MKKYLVIAACVCMSCNTNPVRKDQPITRISKKTLTGRRVEVTQANDDLRTKIRGTWTDGSTNNASFDIQTDSILYVDNLQTYKYTLDYNTIKIYMQDYIYQSKISFKADTMLMTSKDGEVSKFWKFKD